jgi:hypothetical protein
VLFLFDIFNGGYIVIIDIKRNGFEVSFNGKMFISHLVKMCQLYNELK